MLGKISPVIFGLLLAAAGCSLLGGGGLKPEDIAEGDLGTGVEIGELIPDAEEVLLACGIAVEDDWPALEFALAAGDQGLSLFIAADDIDPVIVITDAEGKVIAVGDDWDEELDAFVSIDRVPDGARAIVFDVTGDDGAFTIEAGEGDDFQWMLEPGEDYDSFLLRDKDNSLWENLITDVYDIYREDWETCRVFPLQISGDKWVRISVASDMDLIMAILLVDGDDLEYVDYDDDTFDMNPSFSGELADGTYLVIVNSYAGGEDVEFNISVAELDPDEMTADIVQADEMGEWFTGEFREGSMVLSYWPEAGSYWGLYPEEQVVIFEFSIEESGEYLFDASCYTDVKMAIIDQDMVMIDYNDDGPEGLDPQLILQLSPGRYSALVTPYTEQTTETVDFMFTLTAPVERERGYVPFEIDEYSGSNLYYTLVFDPGETYEIFAESSTDLTLTVVDASGETWFSDDDGGDFNPYLEIEATNANAGAWDIDVESYGGTGISDNVHFVARPVRTPRNTSAPVEIDL